MSGAPRSWPVLAAAALSVVVFLPALGGEFVYDDHRFYAGNDALTSWSVLWRAFSDPVVQTADGTHAGLWRPLRTLSFALDRALFADAAWGPHLVNVLLHGVASGLLGAVLLRLSATPVAAFLGAAVYGVHPAQVEVVAWISSRGDLLAAALVWGALLLALRGRDRWGLLLGGLALLAKEQAIVWPALLTVTLLCDGRHWRAILRRVALPVALVLVFVAVRHVLLVEPLQEGGLGAPGPAGVAAMLGHQVWSTWFPVGALFDWQMPLPARGAAAVVAPLVATLAFAGLASTTTRRATAWFLVALVPTLFIQLVVPLNIRVADRFLLFALPALALIVVRVAALRRGTPAVALGVVCLAVLTIGEIPAWADGSSLWTRTAERSPGHWRAESWLGAQAITDDDLPLAVEHLERAATAGPSDAKTRFLLADALWRLASAGPSEQSVHLTRRARDEFVMCLRLYASGARQEGAELLEPLAMLTMLDLTLVLGERDRAEAMLRSRIRLASPKIHPLSRAAWDHRLELLTQRIEVHLDPGLESPLAPRVREWAALK